MCPGVRVNHKSQAGSGTADRALGGHTFSISILFCVVLGCFALTEGVLLLHMGLFTGGAPLLPVHAVRIYPFLRHQRRIHFLQHQQGSQPGCCEGQRALRVSWCGNFNHKGGWSSMSEGAARQDPDTETFSPSHPGRAQQIPTSSEESQGFWMELCVLGTAAESATQENEHWVDV